MIQIKSQRSEVGSQKAARGLALTRLPFALSLVGVMLFALCWSTEAQQRTKIPRVGFLFSGTRYSMLHESFRQGLRELGYDEGQNIAIEYRYADGDNSKFRGLAVELVNLKLDILVAGGGNDATLALRHATNTIPIVMTAGSYPVDSGIISSLARPGGNITGLTSLWGDLSGKRLELLKETVPKLSRVAVLWQSSRGRSTQWKASQTAGQQLGLQLHSMEVRSADDLENAFKQAVMARSTALAVTQTTLVSTNLQKIAGLATRHRMPAIYAIPEHAESGGLMAYGANRADLYGRAAIHVDKILKGAKPADLPVEQPTKFEFIINLRAAKQIGLTIQPTVLARADKVIR